MHSKGEHKRIQVQALLRSCWVLVPPPAAKCLQVARLNRRGRKPAALPAWEYLPFDIRTPEAHPQHDRELLLGLNEDTGYDIANEP